MPTIVMKSCEDCGTRFAAKSKKHRYCSKECRNRASTVAEPLKYTLTDPSNYLLTAGPSALSCGIMKSEEGQSQMIVTVRTTSSTVTVALLESEAKGWLAEIARTIQEMQGNG